MHNASLRLKDKVFLGIVVLILLFAMGSRLFFHKNDAVLDQPKIHQTVQVMIRDSGLTLDVVSDPAAMYQGLGGRDMLDQSAGMMFVHEFPGMYDYSMRDMRFDLDFLFVRGDRIVDIAERVPATFRGTIAGAVEYDTVIEVNAGWVSQHQVKIGDRVQLVNVDE